MTTSIDTDGSRDGRSATSSTSVDSGIRWLVRLLIVGSGVLALMSLVIDVRGGWSNWKQGDWLINSLEGSIRRGPSGSAMIHVADWLDISPVTVVIATQAILAVILYAVYYRVVVGLPDARWALLLTISPIMFPIFWLAVPNDGALRKELIGFTAVMLMVLYLRERRIWAPILAAVLLAAGSWSHEIVILFIPLFCYLAWLAARQGRAALIWGLTAIVLVSGFVAGLYAISHMRVDTVAQVCDPLLARGIDDSICRNEKGEYAGAISWVTADQERATQSLKRRDLNPTGLRDFAIMAVVSLAPVLYAGWLLARRRLILLGSLAAVPFLPLFALVSDWGRWLGCGVFAFIAVLLAHSVSDGVDLRRRPLVPALAVLSVVGLVLVPYHVNGMVYGGVFVHSPNVVVNFFRTLF